MVRRFPHLSLRACLTWSFRLVTFDLELSGIHRAATSKNPTLGRRQHLEERYREVKEAAERFQILQFGLTTVSVNDKEAGKKEGCNSCIINSPANSASKEVIFYALTISISAPSLIRSLASIVNIPSKPALLNSLQRMVSTSTLNS